MGRGDFSNTEWKLVGPLLPPVSGRWARPAGNSPLFLRMLHVPRVVCRWRDLHARAQALSGVGGEWTGEALQAHPTNHLTSPDLRSIVDRMIAHIMSSYWRNLAKSADSSGTGLPNWPNLIVPIPRWCNWGSVLYPNHVSEKLALLLDWLSRRLERSIFGLGSLPAAQGVGRE